MGRNRKESEGVASSGTRRPTSEAGKSVEANRYISEALCGTTWEVEAEMKAQPAGRRPRVREDARATEEGRELGLTSSHQWSSVVIRRVATEGHRELGLKSNPSPLGGIQEAIKRQLGGNQEAIKSGHHLAHRGEDGGVLLEDVARDGREGARRGHRLASPAHVELCPAARRSATRRRSGGNQAIRRRSGGDQETIRRSGGDQEAIRRRLRGRSGGDQKSGGSGEAITCEPSGRDSPPSARDGPRRRPSPPRRQWPATGAAERRAARAPPPAARRAARTA